MRERARRAFSIGETNVVIPFAMCRSLVIDRDLQERRRIKAASSGWWCGPGASRRSTIRSRTGRGIACESLALASTRVARSRNATVCGAIRCDSSSPPPSKRQRLSPRGSSWRSSVRRRMSKRASPSSGSGVPCRVTEMWFIVVGTSVARGRYHEAVTNPCGPSKISSAGTRASMSAHCGSARAKCPDTTISSSAESSSRQNP